MDNAALDLDRPFDASNYNVRDLAGYQVVGQFESAEHSYRERMIKDVIMRENSGILSYGRIIGCTNWSIRRGEDHHRRRH
jgi:hypothetical protein